MLVPKVFRLNASINAKHEHPAWQPPGIFLRWSKDLLESKIFLQKHGPRGKITTPGEYCRRFSQPFRLTGIEILGFCRENWKAVQLFFGHTLHFQLKYHT